MKFYYYKITNTENGSFYIGVTTDYEKRRKQHLYQLEQGTHQNYKMLKDYQQFGSAAFAFEIIDELEGSEKEGYEHEYQLIQQFEATKSYNILEGGKLNPVYSPQVVEKLKKTHQEKYEDVLQYSFDGKSFRLVARHKGIRDAARNTGADFRAIQHAIRTGNAHHNYYWVKDGEQDKWLETFLKRFNLCVAKVNEQTGEIEDTALTIREFAEKYNTTYQKIYASIIQNNRCERKYKFIRITAKQFAEINKLSL